MVKRLWGPKLLCIKCYRKTKTRIVQAEPLESVLGRKRRVVIRAGGPNGRVSGIVNVPAVLINRMVRVVLADEEEGK